ncbi:hypothetical protein JJD41_15705 [Oxynema sp. CENA135]|uniref:hypothetical protein n=1 Tax=Oxynema sp. CENA135 TaxID=984206 RepID=UPI00190AAC4B|nr:hypothetical protein [Oxynema sp. CENA135]MBK4731294.1 hypothetical protein [Oxynema sp. CENA135]
MNTQAPRIFSLAPAIAGTLAIAASPVGAATLARSESSLEFYNFSHRAISGEVLLNTDSFVVKGDRASEVTAMSDATGLFINEPSSEQYIANFTRNLATGSGRHYFGIGESSAKIIGDFSILDDRPFSFNFNGFLSLETNVDSPRQEAARAGGDFSFFLIDLATDRILDRFDLSGYLSSTSDDDFLSFTLTDGVVVDRSENITSLEVNREQAIAALNGSWQRSFEQPTDLRLVELKRTYAEVSVPEPSFCFGLLLFGSWAGLNWKRRSRDRSAEWE